MLCVRFSSPRKAARSPGIFGLRENSYSLPDWNVDRILSSQCLCAAAAAVPVKVPLSGCTQIVEETRLTKGRLVLLNLLLSCRVANLIPLPYHHLSRRQWRPTLTRYLRISGCALSFTVSLSLSYWSFCFSYRATKLLPRSNLLCIVLAKTCLQHASPWPCTCILPLMLQD